MVKPLLWMRAIRDAKPTTARGYVLLCLALRMNADGFGYASTRQLADDAEVSFSTVERATRWAREREFLERTRKGSRRGDGKALASEWLLTVPVDRSSQPVTGDGFTTTEAVTGDGLSDSQPVTSDSQPVTGASQPVTGVTPEVYLPRGLSSKSVRDLADSWALDSDKPAEPARMNGFGKRHNFKDDPWNIGYCQHCKLPANNRRAHTNPRTDWMRDV